MCNLAVGEKGTDQSCEFISKGMSDFGKDISLSCCPLGWAACADGKLLLISVTNVL